MQQHQQPHRPAATRCRLLLPLVLLSVLSLTLVSGSLSSASSSSIPLPARSAPSTGPASSRTHSIPAAPLPNARPNVRGAHRAAARQRQAAKPSIPPRAEDAFLDAHVSIQQIVLAPPKSMDLPPSMMANLTRATSPPPMLSFEVALFTVHLSRHFFPERHIRGKNRLASEHRKKQNPGAGQNSTDAFGEDDPTLVEDGNDDLATSGLFPEEYEASAEGLTRLICGENAAAHRHDTPRTVFESFPKAEEIRDVHQLKQHHRARGEQGARGHHAFEVHAPEFQATTAAASGGAWPEHHLPDVFLLPLDSIDAFHARQTGDYLHPLYELLHPLFGSAPEVVPGGSRLRYALMMNMEWIPADDDAKTDGGDGAFSQAAAAGSTFTSLTADDLLTCSLHFLPEHHQLLQPSGLYTDADGKVLRGSIHFTAAPPSAGVDAVAEDVADVLHVFDVARRILPVSSDIQREVKEREEREREEEDQRHMSAIALAGVDDVEVSAKESASTSQSSLFPSSASSTSASLPGSDTVFLATEAHLRFFGELAKSLTTAILKPAASAVGGALDGVFFDQVKEKLFQTQEGDLGNEVPNQDVRAEVAPTTYEVVKLVGDRMNAEFPPMLAAALVGTAPPAITSSLTEAITTKTTEQLARSAPFKIGKALVEATVPEILLPLGHILTKALAIGLTPVILHTLDATPHMDYYCYFCSQKQLYCAYCSFAPKQIYYANYYAGYYSTYYSNYYARFSTDAFQRQRNPLDYAHKTQLLGMPDDGVEIVIPIDETMSGWKEEERRKGVLHFSKTLRPQDKA